MNDIMDGGFARPNLQNVSINVPSKNTAQPRTLRQTKIRNPSQHNCQKPRVLHVLIVGEEPANNARLSESIINQGHFAEFACNCHIGLRMASTTQPNIVFLNLNLLINECLQFVKQLRQDYLSKSILIAGLAYDSDASLHRQYITAGVDLIIDAPIKSKLLEILLLLECVRLDNLRIVEQTDTKGKYNQG